MMPVLHTVFTMFEEERTLEYQVLGYLLVIKYLQMRYDAKRCISTFRVVTLDPNQNAWQVSFPHTIEITQNKTHLQKKEEIVYQNPKFREFIGELAFHIWGFHLPSIYGEPHYDGRGYLGYNIFWNFLTLTTVGGFRSQSEPGFKDFNPPTPTPPPQNWNFS